MSTLLPHCIGRGHYAQWLCKSPRGQIFFIEHFESTYIGPCFPVVAIKMELVLMVQFAFKVGLPCKIYSWRIWIKTFLQRIFRIKLRMCKKKMLKNSIRKKNKFLWKFFKSSKNVLKNAFPKISLFFSKLPKVT